MARIVDHDGGGGGFPETRCSIMIEGQSCEWRRSDILHIHARCAQTITWNSRLLPDLLGEICHLLDHEEESNTRCSKYEQFGM